LIGWTVKIACYEELRKYLKNEIQIVRQQGKINNLIFVVVAI